MTTPIKFDFTEADLDKVYIGQWEVFQTDDYNRVKVGSTVHAMVLRSQVNKDAQTITFVGYVPTRSGLSKISMDGSVGLYSKVSERVVESSGDANRIDTFLIKVLTGKEIIEQRQLEHKTEEGYTIIETTGELDDIIFNLTGEYTFPVYYILKGRHPELLGIYFQLSLTKFNHYVKMRDLWYRDYRGSQACHPQEE